MLPIVIHKIRITPIIDKVFNNLLGSFLLVTFSYVDCMIFQPSNGAIGITFKIAVAKLTEII